MEPESGRGAGPGIQSCAICATITVYVAEMLVLSIGELVGCTGVQVLVE